MTAQLWSSKLSCSAPVTLLLMKRQPSTNDVSCRMSAGGVNVRQIHRSSIVRHVEYLSRNESDEKNCGKLNLHDVPPSVDLDRDSPDESQTDSMFAFFRPSCNPPRWISTGMTSRPSVRAAVLTSLNSSALKGLPGSARNANRRKPGTSSRKSSRRFPETSGC